MISTRQIRIFDYGSFFDQPWHNTTPLTPLDDTVRSVALKHLFHTKNQKQGDCAEVKDLNPAEDLPHSKNYLVPAAKLNTLAAPAQKQRKKQRARSVFAWTALILGTIFTLGLIMIAHRPLISWANGRKTP